MIGEPQPFISVVLCIHCAEPMQFDEAMTVQEMDPIVELEMWARVPALKEQFMEIRRRKARRELQAAIDQEARERQ